MYDFEPQAFGRFSSFLKFSLYIWERAKKWFKMNKSQVGAAIFGGGICKNM